MSVPFVDLNVIHRPLAAEFQAVLDRAVADSAFIGGAAVAGFEAAWAGYCGAAHCVGVSSGTDALALALRAAGVGPGEEVVVPANSFVATAEAVVMAGARPAFCDVDPDTHLMTAETLRAALTSRTRAVIPVHLFGQAVNMGPIVALANNYGLLVIEDACQAHGARYCGRRVGSLGSLAACWSFYPAKNLGALGDAGAVTTRDPELAARLRRLRDHGSPAKYVHTEVGGTFRLDALQAGFLSVKLPHLDGWNAARARAAVRYDRQLEGVPGITPVLTDGGSNRHLYVVRFRDSAECARVEAELKRRGIGTGRHYPLPIHFQPAFAYLGCGPGSFPAAENLAGRMLSLPMFAGITDAQVDEVCRALVEVLHDGDPEELDPPRPAEPEAKS